MAESVATKGPDLSHSRLGNFVLWRLPPLVIIATGILGDSFWITVGWTASFAIMGGACLFNALRCGRLHCYLTGPFFLLASLASLLQGLGIISVGWNVIGFSALIGGLFLLYVPERLRGKYVGS